MNIFTKTSLPGIRLIVLSFFYAGFFLIFRFQLALYLFKSAGKLISGFEVVSKISWIIVGSGLFLSLVGVITGLLVMRLNKNNHWLYYVEHRLFYAKLYFLLAWLALLSRTLIFDFYPLDQTAVIGTSIFALLVSLTVKFRAMDAEFKTIRSSESP